MTANAGLVGVTIGLILTATVRVSAETILYANDFSTVGAHPTNDNWVSDGSTPASYGEYKAYNPLPTDMAMRSYGAWSHGLEQNSSANSLITMSLTLENENSHSGANGGFGLSSYSADSKSQFTADGPRMAWEGSTNGLLTFTAPVAAGSGTASARVNTLISDYWRRAQVIMTLDTRTGLAQGYTNLIAASHRVITDFDMKGALSAEQFNALFAQGKMKHFGGKFAGPGKRSWIDDILITSTALPPLGPIVNVLYTNDFSLVGAHPTNDHWVSDGSTDASYAEYKAYNPLPTDMAMRSYGAWSHGLEQYSSANSLITMSLTLENENSHSGANGGFGLSSYPANSQYIFTADGPRMAWEGSTNGLLTFTAPVAAGSGTASARVNTTISDYWRRAQVIMTLDTRTGLAQGYTNLVAASHRVITDFDMKGALSASKFNALFADGRMRHFGGKFAGPGKRSWIDDISITSVLLPPLPPVGTTLVLR